MPLTLLRHLQFPASEVCRLLTNVSLMHSAVLANRPNQPVVDSPSAGICCTTHLSVCKWFSVVLCLKYPLQHEIDSVLANSRIQNSFSSPVPTIFCHNCLLVVKFTSTQWCHIIKLGEIPCLLKCSFLLCLSWLL